MDIADLEVYNLSMNLGEEVWKYVSNWSLFHKDTIGKQLVRSADSVAANISEGFGRFHFKDKIKFYFYARGSLYETKTWLKKASQRNLISLEQFEELNENINKLSVKINNFISVTRKQIKK